MGYLSFREGKTNKIPKRKWYYETTFLLGWLIFRSYVTPFREFIAQPCYLLLHDLSDVLCDITRPQSCPQEKDLVCYLLDESSIILVKL